MINEADIIVMKDDPIAMEDFNNIQSVASFSVQ
jgi:hypothetical protein